ncbi:MAG: S41 family peptidase [Cruoricaptor ignavus]|nr:S41 family peptidase [Cruoricaptor ignavus]
MKIAKYAFLALFSFSLAVSCSRDNDPEPTPIVPVTETPDEINDFVWKAMNSWYYWQPNVANLADSKKLNLAEYLNLINNKTPDKLFYSLLYNYGTTDRFSWIENNNEIVSSKNANLRAESITGLDFTAFAKGQNSNNYVVFVNYVVPNSSADAAGIKRGDVITKINGSYINESNYPNFFSDSFSVTRAETTELSVVNNYYVITTTDKNENLAITKTDVEESPIAYYKTFDLDNKKIGYLVFNSFNIDYNSQLNAKFAEMKSAGITELILDLRYNGGGSLTTALGLGQMITGGYTGQPYVYMKFNSKNANYSGFDNLSKEIEIYKTVDGHPEKTGEVQNINSLFLPKVYILVSHMSASASELTTIALKKYINVEVIGYPTAGKFVGSHTLYDSPNNNYISFENRNRNHNWSLQPITFEYFNKNQEPNPISTALGREAITPDYRVHPYEWINNVKEFGNTTDPDLNKALELILGRTVSRTAKSAQNLDYQFKQLPTYENTSKGLYISNLEEHLESRKK